MHYLTNYYKNLAEQLQERVNKLQNILNEAEIIVQTRTDKAGNPTAGVESTDSATNNFLRMVYPELFVSTPTKVTQKEIEDRRKKAAEIKAEQEKVYSERGINPDFTK